jgi:uncharacterized membrane protein YhaH (DUF805 family)
LGSVLSPAGRLTPQPFVAAALAVYAAGIGAQWLTMQEVLAYAGIWPFAIAQALLVWIWYVLHARRLHDSGRPADVAAGAAALYALSIVLLLIVAMNFFTPFAGAAGPNATAALNIVLLIAVIAALTQSSGHDVEGLILGVCIILAFLPVVVAVAVTLWAATGPTMRSSPGEPKR